jgi:ankyrin repeat protein
MDGPSLPDARTAVTDLLGNGSDPNAPQRGGSSVLHGAVLRRDAALVRLAVRKGAEVRARDEQGRTAALLAEEIGWDEGALLLQDHASLPRDHRASRYAFDHDRNPVRRPDLSDVPRKLQNETTGSSHGNLARVRELVESDPRLVFSHSTDDELAIEASAHVGNHDILRFHLEHGSPCSLPTAVSLGDADFCRFLLDEDPLLIHERGAHDFPLLWYVAIGGAGPDLAAMLYDEYGVPLDQESLGNTTLHWCVMREDHELAEWLLDAGADPSPVGYKWQRQGETPLALAQRNGARKLVDLLQRAGAS